MSRRRLTWIAIVAVAAMLGTSAPGTAAAAASADRTPPTAPLLTYTSPWGCLQIAVGMMRSTDNATPQANLKYEVFANGVRLGTLNDLGHPSGVWGTLRLQQAGTNGITARAVDAAGNRSAPSRTNTVTQAAC
jgi:hypothetical protein